MRILLAVDGSPSSDLAMGLVASLALAADSLVRVIAVHRPVMDDLGLAWPAGADLQAGTDDEDRTQPLRDAVERAEGRILRQGARVEGFLLRGRPGSEIVAQAEEMAADLVVVGSRGHGRIATMVLGSTAAEVVDHAPCPVLVARRESLAPLAFADDGSPAARLAEGVLTSWPLFAGMPVSVLSVAEVGVPIAAGYTPALYDQVLSSYTRSVDEARAETRTEAREEAATLTAAGLQATAVPLEGDPSTEIVRYAAGHDIGTIVMGTRGHTGLARLVLGSTSRNVVLHAPCSVLVVRERR